MLLAAVEITAVWSSGPRGSFLTGPDSYSSSGLSGGCLARSGSISLARGSTLLQPTSATGSNYLPDWMSYTCSAMILCDGSSYEWSWRRPDSGAWCNGFGVLPPIGG